MTTAMAQARSDHALPRTGVGVVPWARCLLALLPMLLAWLLVVVLGRAVCRVAQHVPPVVALVRAVQRSQEPAPAASRRVGPPGPLHRPQPR